MNASLLTERPASGVSPWLPEPHSLLGLVWGSPCFLPIESKEPSPPLPHTHTCASPFPYSLAPATLNFSCSSLKEPCSVLAPFSIMLFHPHRVVSVLCLANAYAVSRDKLKCHLLGEALPAPSPDTHKSCPSSFVPHQLYDEALNWGSMQSSPPNRRWAVLRW